jgi:hypothetical protein
MRNSRDGPYTRDPARVKLILNPDTVQASIDRMLLETMGFIKQVMQRRRITDPRQLSVELVARACAARPQVSMGGAT